jgi:quercetin dioxygenase-like cupin family protein
MPPDIRSGQPPGSVLRHVVDGTPHTAVDVFGPTVEFLSGPDDPDAELCVMRGVVPPGVTVPLHSHDDAEDFFILSGTQQVLFRGDDHALRWYDVHPGDYVHIPGGIPHALRNVSNEPAIELLITTARLGRFFREIARPTADLARPPTPDELVEFAAVATKYGYVLGTPDENAAVGIELGPL